MTNVRLDNWGFCAGIERERNLILFLCLDGMDVSAIGPGCGVCSRIPSFEMNGGICPW